MEQKTKYSRLVQLHLVRCPWTCHRCMWHLCTSRRSCLPACVRIWALVNLSGKPEGHGSYRRTPVGPRIWFPYLPVYNIDCSLCVLASGKALRLQKSKEIPASSQPQNTTTQQVTIMKITKSNACHMSLLSLVRPYLTH